MWEISKRLSFKANRTSINKLPISTHNENFINILHEKAWSEERSKVCWRDFVPVMSVNESKTKYFVEILSQIHPTVSLFGFSLSLFLRRRLDFIPFSHRIKLCVQRCRIDCVKLLGRRTARRQQQLSKVPGKRSALINFISVINLKNRLFFPLLKTSFFDTERWLPMCKQKGKVLLPPLRAANIRARKHCRNG